MKFSDQELLELYRQRSTNREIANQLGVTQASVYYRLQKLGLQNNCHAQGIVNLKRVKNLHRMENLQDEGEN